MSEIENAGQPARSDADIRTAARILDDWQNGRTRQTLHAMIADALAEAREQGRNEHPASDT